ncbi:MAG: ABC transporter permease [Armatimonadetes bacterium]|nr:ABC transporter permease [Armatimonadota bacterium]
MRRARSRSYAIFRKELKQVRRDPGTLALIVVMPILLLLLYGYGVSTDIRDIPMVVLDESRSPQSRDFIRSFTGSGFFRLEGYVSSLDEVDRHLDAGRARIGIVIKPTFARKIVRAEKAEVLFAIDGSEPNTANAAISYVSTIVARYSARVIAKELRSRIPLDKLNPIDLRPRVWYNPELRSINFIVPGLIVIILMNISTLLTSVTIAREREQGTLEPLIASPIHAWELMLGKIGAYTLISFIDIVLVLVVGTLWFHVPFRGSVITLMAMSTVFLLSSLGLGLFVSARSPTQQSAVLTAFLITMIPGLLLSGFLFPISSMPKPVQALTYLVPARYFLVIVRGIFLKGIGIADLWRQLLPMAILSLALFILSIRSFRKQMG